MDNVTDSSHAAAATDRRFRQRERTRSRILAAALELFQARGYAGTTMDEIADGADVARRTLFNHFPTKQAILAAWRAERGEQLTSALSGAAEEGGVRQPAAELLRQQFAVLAELSKSDFSMTILLVQGRLVEISNAGELFPIFEPVRTVVESGQSRAEFSTAVPASVVGEVLSSCYVDTVSRWALPQIDGRPAPFDLDAALTAKLDLVLNGLAVDKPSQH